MNPFVWSDDHKVGLPEIDDEHRALFHMAAQLYDEIETGTAEESVDGYLERLTSYGRFHFENEEALMCRTGFPEYEVHRREHESFGAALAFIRGFDRTGNADKVASLTEFLRRWFSDHVCGSDRRFAAHIVQKGSRL
jgi:hemerythrin